MYRRKVKYNRYRRKFHLTIPPVCYIFPHKDESVTFPETDSGYLSVFAYSKKAEGVTLKGLKYELADACLTDSFPLGVSNEFVGKKSSVDVRKGVLLLVLDK